MNELLNQKIVVTRKPHNCFGCGRSFPAGTLMRSETVKDFKLFRYYLCCTCQDLVDIMDPQDEYYYGDLLEDALEAEKEIN